jgi:hypothetical protein
MINSVLQRHRIPINSAAAAAAIFRPVTLQRKTPVPPSVSGVAASGSAADAVSI